MLEAPFEIREPTTVDETPVVVEVPHAGLWVDAESAMWTIAPVRAIACDADLYVDELFARAPALGASFIFSRLSRYVVDLNRADSDFDGTAVLGGPTSNRPRGVIWRLSSSGLPVLRNTLPVHEYQRRMCEFYRPYHDALRDLLNRKVQRFGFAVLLCAHSMPSPRKRGRAHAPHIADIVPGTRGRTSAADGWIDIVEEEALAHDLEVEHDVPYRGGFATRHYGRPDAGVHAVQVEIARRLYMDESSLSRLDDGFPRIAKFAEQLVKRLVSDAKAAVEVTVDAAPTRPDAGVS